MNIDQLIFQAVLFYCPWTWYRAVRPQRSFRTSYKVMVTSFFFFSLFLHRLLHCIDIALLALHHLFAVTERYKYIYIYKYDIYIFKFYRARPAVLRSHEEEVCECLFFFFFFLSIKL